MHATFPSFLSGERRRFGPAPYWSCDDYTALAAGECFAISVTFQESLSQQDITRMPDCPDESAFYFSPWDLFPSCSAVLHHGFCRDSSTHGSALFLKGFYLCAAGLAEMGERWKLRAYSCLVAEDKCNGTSGLLWV